MRNTPTELIYSLGDMAFWRMYMPLITGVLLVMVLTGGCKMDNSSRLYKDNDSAYKVIGYVGNGVALQAAEASLLTHVNYAFVRIDEAGKLYFVSDTGPADVASLVGLKKEVPSLKILVSIGGWGADYFSDVALTDSSRSLFANRVGEFVKAHDLDGVDLDWEFPGQPGPGIKYRKEDRENFTLLLQAIRQHLDEMGKGRYLLTIATNDDAGYFANTQMDTLHHFVDYINVMSYDFYTVGSATTGHHSGLYRSKADSISERFTRAGIERHLNAGIPPEKIVMGVAFYGRGWSGVTGADNGLYQSFDSFYGAYGYEHITEHFLEKNGFERYWDDTAKAPYLWNADSSIFISYEDPESLKYKMAFIQQHNLGGVMFWEYRHDDKDGTMLRALHKALD